MRYSRKLCLLCVVSLILTTFTGCRPARSPEPRETVGSIERLDPEFDRLVPPGNAIEKLAEGFEWSEGPLWLPDDQALLFSDIPRNVVNRWKEGEGVSEFLKPSGYTGDTPAR